MTRQTTSLGAGAAEIVSLRTSDAPGDQLDPISPSLMCSDGDRRRGPERRRRRRSYLLAGGGYLALSLILWWHVLPHLRSVTTCGCGDAALTLWVIKWPAYALSHGLNPFYSSKLFVPRGINMAPNSLGLGIVVAPVTWLFGPVASLNLIDLLSPPLSALAMFWLLRRWMSWVPAAFVGGLFFGFSPFVLVSLALAHPNFGLLAPVPLIVGCVDDLLVRHRFPAAAGRDRARGAGGGRVLHQRRGASPGDPVRRAGGDVRGRVGGDHPQPVRPSGRPQGHRRRRFPPSPWRPAWPWCCWPIPCGSSSPAPLIWSGGPGPTLRPARWSMPRVQFVDGFISAPLTGIMHLFGGYQGPTLPLLCFLGIGVIVVAGGGAVIWRRDPLMRFFSLLGLLAAVFSLGVVGTSWTPWRLFATSRCSTTWFPSTSPPSSTPVWPSCWPVVVDHSRSAVPPAGWGEARP